MGVIVGEINHDKLKKLLNISSMVKRYRNKAYMHCVKGDALLMQEYYFEAIEEYLISVSHNEKGRSIMRLFVLSEKTTCQGNRLIASLY